MTKPSPNIMPRYSKDSVMGRLLKRYNHKCHYCKRYVNTTVNHPMSATKDHIVPKAMGGANDISNYVLACRDCNNRRGMSLFFCSCAHCKRVIKDGLSRKKVVDTAFDNIVKYCIKPYIRKRDGVWMVRLSPHNNVHFDTFEEAIAAYATLDPRDIDNTTKVG